MSLIHYLYYMCPGKYGTFEERYSYMQKQIKMEQLENLQQFIKNDTSLENVLELVG